MYDLFNHADEAALAELRELRRQLAAWVHEAQGQLAYLDQVLAAGRAHLKERQGLAAAFDPETDLWRGGEGDRRAPHA